MKSTTILVMLCACVMVTMAMKAKKFKCQQKLKKVTEKVEMFDKLWNANKCEGIAEWSVCDNGKMTKSYKMDADGDASCTAMPAEEMSCVVTGDQKETKKGCSSVKTMDYTGCSSMDGKIQITITITCSSKVKSVNTEKPCQKKYENLKFKRDLFHFKQQQLDLMCNKNCTYKRQRCGEGETEIVLENVGGGTQCNDYQLVKPCSSKMQNKAGQKRKAMKKNKKVNKKANKQAKLAKKQKRKEKKRRQECKYRKGEWSDCDAVTGKQSMKRNLKRGDPDHCQPVQVIERLCRNKTKQTVCKYKRTAWSVCDGLTNVKRMVKTLKQGSPDQCDSTQVVDKICKRKHRGLKGSICKYNRGIWSECDLTTGKQSMQKPLKPGNQPMCPPFKLVQRPCRGKSRKGTDACKYRKNGRWRACDVNNHTMSRNMILVQGNRKICPLKKVLTKPCRQRSQTNGKCKYDKSQWGPCDAASNTVTRTLTLKHGDPTVCNTTRIDVRKCKDKHLRPHVCKYRRTNWGECDPSTSMKQMVKTLKRGDPSLCKPTEIIEKKCKKKKTNGNVCKYRFEPWSACVDATNTMTRRQMLESGPSTCAPIKEYSKKCKKPCNFMNGEWSACDPVSKQMTRVDILKQGSANYCNKTRVLSKKCGKREKRCVYDYGEWSECDESDNPKRSRVQTLVAGGENCDQRKTLRKPCKKPNGEVRCFFGPWTDYEECQNGVQKKRRLVLQGGMDCDRKGVKMKSC